MWNKEMGKFLSAYPYAHGPFAWNRVHCTRKRTPSIRFDVPHLHDNVFGCVYVMVCSQCFPQTTDQETEKFRLKGGPGRFIPGRVAPSMTLKLIPHEKNVQDGDLNLPRAMRAARERRVDSFNAQLDCFAGSNDPRCRDVEHFGRKRPDGGIDGLGNLSKRRSLSDAYTGHSLCSIMWIVWTNF